MTGVPSEIIYLGVDHGVEMHVQVFGDGRLVLHMENDGPQYYRPGSEARAEIVDLYHIGQRYPEIVKQVEETQIRLGMARLAQEPPEESQRDHEIQEAKGLAYDCLCAAVGNVDRFTQGKASEHRLLMIAAQTQAIAALLAAQKIADAITSKVQSNDVPF